MNKRFYYGYVILFALFILQMVMFSPRSSFGVFIKPITAEFDWSRALVSGAFSISSIVQGLSGIIMGWINDRIGPRIVLTICGILVGAGLMLMFLVDSAWQLYFFYIIPVGVGMGGLFSPQMSTVARWFVKRRNIMTAILLAGGGLGAITGPPLITWLIYTYSWQEAFLFVGAGVLILVILFAQFLKRDPSQIGQVPFGEGSEIREIEKRVPANSSGLSLKQAFQTKKFWLFAITIFCFGFCCWTVMVHIVPLAIDRGISPATAAIILSVMNGATTAGSITVGLIADKIGSRRAFFTSIYLIFAIILLLIPVTSAWLLGVFVIILSLGLGGIAVTQSSMVAELFGMQSHGAILGCTVFTFTLGGASGTFVAGSVFDSTGSYQWVFLLCGVLVVASMIMAVYLNRIRKTKVLV